MWPVLPSTSCPRYVRYDIDMLYYLTIKEPEQMEYEVYKAVSAAVEYVSQHRNDRANST